MSSSSGTLPAVDPDLRLTETGATVGTPLYMAPEQHQGGPVDARADQYAFCAALFEALLGRAPHSGKSVHHLAQAKQRPPELPADRRGVPRRVLAVLLRG